MIHDASSGGGCGGFDVGGAGPCRSVGEGDVLQSENLSEMEQAVVQVFHLTVPKGGNNSTIDDQNTNLAVNPLAGFVFEDFWMQHERGCDKVPPSNGESLALPAGGEFTVRARPQPRPNHAVLRWSICFGVARWKTA